MDSLKAALARQPLLWFFALTLVPGAVVLLPAVGTLPYGASLNAIAYPLTASLAAVLLCWAADTDERLARQPRRRALGFIAVSATTGLVALLLFRHLNGRPSQLLWVYLGASLLCGYVVCCAWSPVQAVRDLVRPLFRWRVAWSRYAFALLVWPLLGAFILVVSGLLPTSRQYVPPAIGPRLGDVPRLAEGAVLVLMLAIPYVVGWYGYAARRLLVRHSPLVVALLLGLLLVAVNSVVVLFLSVALRFMLLDDLGTVSGAVIAIWLYGACGGSLFRLPCCAP